MLIGSNLNEFGYNNRAIITPQTVEQVKATLTQRYGAENAEKYIAAYKEAYPSYHEPQHILTTALRTNVVKQAAAKSAQSGAPAYVYLFEWQSPVNDGSLGACHGMELPFMFNNIAMARSMTGGGEDAYALADKINSTWIAFVKTGDPNCKALPDVYARQLKMLTVMDEFTRGGLAIEVDHRMGAKTVCAVLTQMMATRGRPEFVRSDNGPPPPSSSPRR